MEIGIDSFAAILPDPQTGKLPTATERMANLIEEVEVILAAAAARTSQIRLASAVTIISAADPVRVFQEFATLDLIAKGRAEIVVGRGSFAEAFPLFGLAARDYGDLFAEKLDLLLKLREATHVKWKGRFRPALDLQGIYPRPHQARLPIWIGVGGTPDSFIRAGTLGLPLMIAIIGGTFERFRPLVDMYREAARAWLGTADTSAIRQHGGPRRGLPGRQSGNSCRKDALRERSARRPSAHHVPDEHCIS